MARDQGSKYELWTRSNVVYLIRLLLPYSVINADGAGRDRTDDPRLAKPALSQLSYSPVLVVRTR